MYTIKRAAELTGVAVTTLRAWERRYGIVTPARTDGGYRLYDAAALRALTVMSSLVHEGWTPKLAAQEVKRRLAAEAQPPASAEPVEGDPGALTRSADERLLAAAARLDPVAVAELLDEVFARGSYERVVDGWLMPAMARLGAAWSDGAVSVAGEHLVSYAVQRRLAAAYEAAGSPPGGPRVVIGLPPGSRHELGLLAFATAARRAGLSTVYVGADLPAEDWSAAVSAQRAVGAVLAAACAEDLDALEDVVAGLHADHPDLLVAVGGRLQDEAPPGCLRLGHDLGLGARRLADALAVAAPGPGPRSQTGQRRERGQLGSRPAPGQARRAQA